MGWWQWWEIRFWEHCHRCCEISKMISCQVVVESSGVKSRGNKIVLCMLGSTHPRVYPMGLNKNREPLKIEGIYIKIQIAGFFRKVSRSWSTGFTRPHGNNLVEQSRSCLLYTKPELFSCFSVNLVECAITDILMENYNQSHRPRYQVAFWCWVRFGIKRTPWSMDTVIVWLTTSRKIVWVEPPSLQVCVLCFVGTDRPSSRRAVRVFWRPLGAAFEL